MDKKVLILIGATAVSLLSACSGSGGGGSGQPGGNYKPNIIEPKFESLGKLDPNKGVAMDQHCSKQAKFDPRIQPGQVYVELSEGLEQKGQTVFSRTEEKSVQVASPERLNYIIDVATQGIKVKASIDQKCKQSGDTSSCETPEVIYLSPLPAGMTEGSNRESSETCETRWSWNGEGGESVYTSEIGYVTLVNGERVLAIRTISEYPTKNQCPNPVTAKSRRVSIQTYALPALWSGSNHCYSTVYSKEGIYASDSGTPIKEDISLLSGHPKTSDLKSYAGLENVESLFQKEKAAEPVAETKEAKK